MPAPAAVFLLLGRITAFISQEKPTRSGAMQLKKILTGISGASALLGLVLGFLQAPEDVANAAYLASVLSGGYFVGLAAIRGLLEQKFLNINFLVIVASAGAIYINQLPEAAAVIFFFSLAEVFEEYGIERAKRAIESLVSKSPQTATLKGGNVVKAAEVRIKDVVVVRPGEAIPLDGVVVNGESSVDESAITGESLPQYKVGGNNVFAGTLNLNGFLEIEVTKESKDSTYSKIIKLVERAQSSRAPSQEFIDRFAKYYTPGVVSAAAMIAAVPPLFFNGVFDEWLYRALVLLVIACPCALVISSPASIASAIGGAARRGILIKGGRHLEDLGRIRAAAFDKTRTLTIGKPSISRVVTFNEFSEKQLLEDAAGIERFSSHPLAKSILDYSQRKGVEPHVMEKFEDVAGKGGKARCLVCKDVEHCIGNLKLIGAGSKTSSDVVAKVEELEKEGNTVVLVSEGEVVMGALAISDQVRPESGEAIAKLKGMGIETAILTGDNRRTAEFVGRALGIESVNASLLPDEKVQTIEGMKKRYGYVAMVGDGVNDSPSLAASTVGIAMGMGGSDVAIETSDVTLMKSNLLDVPYSIRLGRRTKKTIKHNIGVSLGVKAIFLVLAVLGLVHLEYAIAADSGVAILVIANGLRLFNFRGQ